jgi:hypothetical protein
MKDRANTAGNRSSAFREFARLYRVIWLLQSRISRTLKGMEVHFAPDVERKLNDLASQSGRGSAEALVQDVVGGYIDQLAQTREMLDSRYDDLKSGKVKPVDGEEFFESLRNREDDLLNRQ